MLGNLGITVKIDTWAIPRHERNKGIVSFLPVLPLVQCQSQADARRSVLKPGSLCFQIVLRTMDPSPLRKLARQGEKAVSMTWRIWGKNHLPTALLPGCTKRNFPMFLGHLDSCLSPAIFFQERTGVLFGFCSGVA